MFEHYILYTYELSIFKHYVFIGRWNGCPLKRLSSRPQVLGTSEGDAARLNAFEAGPIYGTNMNGANFNGSHIMVPLLKPYFYDFLWDHYNHYNHYYNHYYHFMNGCSGNNGCNNGCNML